VDQKLIGRQLSNAVRELPLDFPVRIASLDEAFSPETRVQDGLGLFSDLAQIPGKDMPEPAKSAAPVYEAGLLGSANIRRLPMPDPARTRIQQGRLIFSPRAKSITTRIDGGAIRMFEPLQESTAGVRDGRQLLLQDAEIRSTARISELPHRRKSMNIESLKDRSAGVFFMRPKF